MHVFYWQCENYKRYCLLGLIPLMTVIWSKYLTMSLFGSIVTSAKNVYLSTEITKVDIIIPNSAYYQRSKVLFNEKSLEESLF